MYPGLPRVNFPKGPLLSGGLASGFGEILDQFEVAAAEDAVTAADGALARG